MRDYIKKWTLMRTLRLIIGIVIVVQGAYESQWMLVGLGAIFSLMPLFNISMCGVGGCEVPQHRQRSRVTEDVKYEEVK